MNAPIILVLSLAALVPGAAAPLEAKDPVKTPRGPLTGNWGGDHAGAVLTDRGAKFDFDCAEGSIDGPITPDGEGRFDLAGTYIQDAPGPTRPGREQGRPARYRGRVERDTMTLSVELPGSDVVIGTFKLVRDRLPRVRKCG